MSELFSPRNFAILTICYSHTDYGGRGRSARGRYLGNSSLGAMEEDSEGDLSVTMLYVAIFCDHDHSLLYKW